MSLSLLKCKTGKSFVTFVLVIATIRKPQNRRTSVYFEKSQIKVRMALLYPGHSTSLRDSSRSPRDSAWKAWDSKTQAGWWESQSLLPAYLTPSSL